MHTKAMKQLYLDSFPPNVYLENDKSWLDAEGPDHYNMFSLECTLAQEGQCQGTSCHLADSLAKKAEVNRDFI